SGKASSIKLYVDGVLRAVEVVQDNLSGPVSRAAALQIGAKKFGNPYKGQLDDLRMYARPLNAAEVEQLAIDEPARSTLASAKRSTAQKDALRDYFLTRDAPAPIRSAYADLKTLQSRK